MLYKVFEQADDLTLLREAVTFELGEQQSFDSSIVDECDLERTTTWLCRIANNRHLLVDSGNLSFYLNKA